MATQPSKKTMITVDRLWLWVYYKKIPIYRIPHISCGLDGSGGLLGLLSKDPPLPAARTGPPGGKGRDGPSLSLMGLGFRNSELKLKCCDKGVYKKLN